MGLLLRDRGADAACIVQPAGRTAGAGRVEGDDMEEILAALMSCAALVTNASAAVDFSREIKPLIESACLSCHKEGKGEAGALSARKVPSRFERHVTNKAKSAEEVPKHLFPFSLRLVPK